MSEVTPTTCANHPERETALRCNRCEKYICPACAVRVAVGYRCKECVREQGQVFNTAKTQDYILAFIVAGVLSWLGSFIAALLGFFVFFIAPAIGIGIAEAVRFVVQRRRAKRLFQVAVAGVVAGVLPSLGFSLLGLLFGAGFQALYAMLWPGLYVALAATATYARLAGIQIR